MHSLVDIPLIEVKKGKPLSVSLPFGAELRSVMDIADGVPTDSALAHSLLLQVTPLLGSMACMLKMLKVIGALKSTAESGFVSAGALIGAIADMSDCLGIVLGPVPICSMSKDIVKLVIVYIKSMIEAAESLLKFSDEIDFEAAKGNPVLLATLENARKNAQTSFEALNEALLGIQPVMEMVNMALEVVGVGAISVPALGSPSFPLGGGDRLKPFKDIVQALETAANALPC